MNKAVYTVCGPILASFFFEMTINPKRLPNRPSMIIAGARYVAEKTFKSNSISFFLFLEDLPTITENYWNENHYFEFAKSVYRN